MILKCLQKDPAQRYATAADLRADLERVTTGVAPVAARPRHLPLVIAAVIALLAIAAGAWFSLNRRREPANVARIRARRSVAVLGFKDLSGKPDQDWLSTALSEMLTSELGAGESLRTVSGEDVARLKIDMGLPATDSLAQDTLRKVHKALGSDLVVLGSYIDVGGQLRLDVRMQDAVAGETIATVSETGSDAQLLQLVSRTGDELRQKVGIAPVTSTQAAQIKTTQPASSEATRAYAQGLDKLRTFDALAARDLLEEAVKLDDTFALAHSALAQAWSQLGYDQKAKDEAKRAFDSSDGLSRQDRLVIEGRYLAMSKNWPKTVEIYQTLYTFFPDNLEYGLRLADAQTRAGKAKDGLATIAELHKLPPPAGDDPRIDLQEAYSAAGSDLHLEETAAERARQKAKAAGLQLLEARALSTVGAALYDLGKPKEAMASYQEALKTYERLGDRGRVANTYFQMSMAVEDQGDYPGARKLAERSLALSEEIGNINTQANALNEIAITLRHGGDFPSAIKALEKSYALKKQVGDRGGMIAARANLANVLDQQGDLDAAERAYEEALAISQEIGGKRYEAITWGNIANNNAKRGNIPQAIAYFNRGLELSRGIGNKFATLYQLCVLSSVLANSGDLAAAEQRAQEALQMAREANEQNYVSWATAESATIVFMRGDLQTARQQYQQAQEGYSKAGEKNQEAQMSFALADIAREQGNFSEAEQLARNAIVELAKEKAQTASLAHAIRAEVLLAEGKLKEAQDEAATARKTSSATQDLSIRVPVQITYARVQARVGSAAQAANSLQKLSADCKKRQMIYYYFEARLALGEILMRSDPQAGRATLQSLAHDARERGFNLIARKAAAIKPAA